MTFLMPCALAAPRADSIRAFSPDIIICPGALKLAANPVALLPDDRRHSARAPLAGLLHQSRSLGHDPQSRYEIKNTRRSACRQFTEAQAEGHSRQKVVLPMLAHSRQNSHPVHVEGGLADFGLRERRLGAVKRHFCKIPAQDRIGLIVKGAGRRRRGVKRLAHTDALGALACK
jgi:hypothetical protein